ncbi:MAG: protein translocase subunit SecD, partial [Alphaproteobacteria bacterium HGW-Alphaproteobacteria-2]
RQPAPPGELHVRISRPEGMASAQQAARRLSQPVLSLTGLAAQDYEISAQGDVLVMRLTEDERRATDDRTLQQSLEIIRRRVDEVGTREPTIMRQGADRVLIQVPGIGSAEELKALIGTTARLTFHPVAGRTTDAAAAPGPGNMLVPSLDEPGVFYILEDTPVVTGEELTDAQPAFDQNGRPAVNFRFNPSGARRFGDYTAQNIGSPFAIVLDDEVISAPVIQSHIPGGSGIITGR